MAITAVNSPIYMLHSNIGTGSSLGADRVLHMGHFCCVYVKIVNTIMALLIHGSKNNYFFNAASYRNLNS